MDYSRVGHRNGMTAFGASPRHPTSALTWPAARRSASLPSTTTDSEPESGPTFSDTPLTTPEEPSVPHSLGFYWFYPGADIDGRVLTVLR